jgi:hypothetical protein
MVEEGAGEVAPVLGGGIDALVVGVEEPVVEVVEAAEGVIIDTIPGAYFFTFSKKPRSSERGRPWEELTFSQSTSSPCAQVSTMAPLSASLHRAALHQKNRIFRGVESRGKFLRISSWHIRLFLGPQPKENPCQHATSQLEDFLNRYPIQL